MFGTDPHASPFAGLVNKVKLFCTTYDPSSDSYKFDYSLFVGMFIGATIIAGGIAYLVRETRRARRV